MTAPSVLFAGGGTGGHLLPGVAVAEALGEQRPDLRPVYAVTDRDLAGAWGDAARGDRIHLASPRLPRRPAEGPAFALALALSVARSLRVLRRERVRAVVALGGYGCVGPALAGLVARRPVVCLEANAVPGAAVCALQRWGALVAASFAGTPALLPRPDRVVVTGNPLRRSVLAGRRGAHGEFGLAPGRPVLAVVGGSLGARGLNGAVAAALPRIARSGAQLLWITGPEDAEAMRAAAAAAGVPACVLPYCADMGALYGTADLLLARSGGGAVAEAAAMGVPAVFVPYPHHADRQQEHNARALVAIGAAKVVDEAALDPARFEAEVLALLGDRELLRLMAGVAMRQGMPDAADRVARLVGDLALPAGEPRPGVVAGSGSVAAAASPGGRAVRVLQA